MISLDQAQDEYDNQLPNDRCIYCNHEICVCGAEISNDDDEV
jgi:hypothetical protein